MKAGPLTVKFAALVVAALTAACTVEPGPPLTVSDIQLFAPLPGSHAAVGYLSLHNQSNAPLTIESISSPGFGKVQMHETIIRDGVASMLALPSVTIEPGASVKFAAGGKHLMLMQPEPDTATGTNVALQINYDTDGLLIISATMQSRLPAE